MNMPSSGGRCSPRQRRGIPCQQAPTSPPLQLLVLLWTSLLVAPPSAAFSQGLAGVPQANLQPGVSQQAAGGSLQEPSGFNLAAQLQQLKEAQAAASSTGIDPGPTFPLNANGVPQAGGGRETYAESEGASKPAIGSVCWTSIPLKDLPRGRSTDGIPGVAAVGLGCSRCVVGSTCSFTITVQEPASWKKGPWNAHMRELNVVLAGPALHAARVQPGTMEDTSFVVTYRIWDAGVYRVSVRSSCGALNYSSNPRQTQPHEMASWHMEVRHVASRQAAKWLLQRPGDPTSLRLVPGIVSDFASLTSPCSVQVYGRWLKESSSYRWTPFPCARTSQLAAGKWVEDLNKNGIYEISFIGDSHQRMLMLHLRYLLTGEFTKQHGQSHSNFNYTVRSGAGQLVLKFYWLTGVPSGPNQFGCAMAGRNKKDSEIPTFSPSADVWFVGTGSWTGGFCAKPELAFAAYTADFWLNVKNQCDAAARTRFGSRKRQPLFVYRPVPPRATETLGCDSRLTNKYVNAANDILRALAPRVEALAFDSWAVEAARFTEPCPRDRHFSCPVHLKGSGKPGMGGAVGEGDVLALLHFLLNN